VLLHTLRFTLDPEGYFADAQRRHGDMFTLRILGQRWVAIAHPETVKELFSHGPEEVDSGEATRRFSPVLGTRNLLLLGTARSTCTAGGSSACVSRRADAGLRGHDPSGDWARR